jgi:hypothetical protein
MPQRSHRIASLLVVTAAAAAWAAQPATVAVADHQGWPAYALGNGLVSVAVVPAIGGRLMRYDLGTHPFLWTNPLEAGKTYEPAEDAPWRNFGGYKTWPAPQLAWRHGLGVWPPPPRLDGGAWSAEIEAGEGGRAVLATVSPVEDFPSWQSAGLQFARRYTLHPGCTRLHVEQSMLNTGKTPATASLWDVTQVIGAHPGADDYDKFWVYFPLNRRSAFGPNGYMAYGGFPTGYGDGQWKTYADDGIGAVQYLHHLGKLGNDSDGGWICYVDERDGYAYAKRFAHADSGNRQIYPEGGLTTAVFTSGAEPYLEVEVMSPLVELAPGARYDFAEDWYCARTGGPVLAVGEAGIVRRRLVATPGAKTLHASGAYGVFYEGTVALVAIGPGGKRTALGSYYATPTQPCVLEVDVPMPAAGQTRLVLEVLDGDGTVVGTLDGVDLPR